MNKTNKKILCVVPARGGSKSIPRKNLQVVAGVSLVGRAALIIQELGYIDRAIVSTDDIEIAEEAVKYGLEAPFMRPERLSQDLSTSLDMWKHAWISAENYYDEIYDVSILLEPTSPLRRPEDITTTVNKIINEKYAAAVTVSKNPAHFTPEKTLVINLEGEIDYFIGSEGKAHHNRQTIPDYYHRNGVCYAVTRDHLLVKNKILENSCPVVIDRQIVNIDEPFELDLVSWLLGNKTKKA